MHGNVRTRIAITIGLRLVGSLFTQDKFSLNGMIVVHQEWFEMASLVYPRMWLRAWPLLLVFLSPPVPGGIGSKAVIGLCKFLVVLGPRSFRK